MMVRLLGAMKLGEFRAGFFVVVSNEDSIRCAICGQVFRSGEHIGKACLEGLPWVDHHVRCASACRQRVYTKGKAGAGGRSPMAG